MRRSPFNSNNRARTKIAPSIQKILGSKVDILEVQHLRLPNLDACGHNYTVLPVAHIVGYIYTQSNSARAEHVCVFTHGWVTKVDKWTYM